MTIAEVTTAERTATRLLWLDLTRNCQLQCTHCYNSSGPEGTHGAMTRDDWIRVLDQAASCGVRRVQFIGGEPTMHPAFAELVDHALNVGLSVEVYSNLVHISAECWKLFQRQGLSLATSYYSEQAEEHNAMTGRPSHRRTRANIKEAARLGIPLRVGVVVGSEAQRVSETRRELEELGVTRIGVDHVRPFGRGAEGLAPDPANLCGRCGSGAAAISPSGDVSPCVFSDWMSVGNVRNVPLAAILSGVAMAEATTVIRRSVRDGGGDDKDRCDPACEPNEECSPGFPSAECDPRS